MIIKGKIMTELERIGILERRLANIIQIGVITEINAQQAKVKVKIGGLITSWLKWLTQRSGDCTTWWAPSLGEQVLILSPSGELNNGIVLPSIYMNNQPSANLKLDHKVYADGTTISYDYDSQTLKVSSQGVINYTAKDLFSLKTKNTQIHSNAIDMNAQTINIKGDLVIDGNIKLINGDVIADQITLKGHHHLGDSGGYTSAAQ